MYRTGLKVSQLLRGNKSFCQSNHQIKHGKYYVYKDIIFFNLCIVIKIYYVLHIFF